MPFPLTAFTESHLPIGDEVVAFVSINGESDGSAEITCRDRTGAQVMVKVPASDLRRMANDLFGWRCTGNA